MCRRGRRRIGRIAKPNSATKCGRIACLACAPCCASGRLLQHARPFFGSEIVSQPAEVSPPLSIRPHSNSPRLHRPIADRESRQAQRSQISNKTSALRPTRIVAESCPTSASCVLHLYYLHALTAIELDLRHHSANILCRLWLSVRIRCVS